MPRARYIYIYIYIYTYSPELFSLTWVVRFYSRSKEKKIPTGLRYPPSPRGSALLSFFFFFCYSCSRSTVSFLLSPSSLHHSRRNSLIFPPRDRSRSSRSHGDRVFPTSFRHFPCSLSTRSLKIKRFQRFIHRLTS